MFEDELAQWISDSPFLRRSFREVAVIAGLIDRVHPGQHKSGKQVTFSSDLIYDVLRRHEPDHLLLTARRGATRGPRSPTSARLAALLERSQTHLVHRALDRVSPLAVPVLLEVGKERVFGAADDALLAEADALAREAMRLD